MKKEAFLLLLILVVACTTASQPLDIPYHKQQGPSCVQSQMLMAIKYYNPDSQLTQVDLDQRTGRQQNQWTWFSQAIPILIEEGLDAYYYSLTPYDKLTPEFVNEFYGDDGPFINSVTNWESLQNSIEFLENNPSRYQYKKTAWSEVESSFQKGHVILMIIDVNVLNKIEGTYAGHGITITNINKTHVTFHNSNSGPNQVAEKQQFQKAWNTKGTDNDIIIIKGTI